MTTGSQSRFIIEKWPSVMNLMDSDIHLPGNSTSWVGRIALEELKHSGWVNQRDRDSLLFLLSERLGDTSACSLWMSYFACDLRQRVSWVVVCCGKCLHAIKFFSCIFVKLFELWLFQCLFMRETTEILYSSLKRLSNKETAGIN